MNPVSSQHSAVPHCCGLPCCFSTCFAKSLYLTTTSFRSFTSSLYFCTRSLRWANEVGDGGILLVNVGVGFLQFGFQRVHAGFVLRDFVGEVFVFELQFE